MEKTIIEINGVKMEVDLRHAKRLDTFKVGDNVKVLKKEYGDSYTSYPGAIIGFDEFKELPTIVVCYLKGGYAPSVEFEYINNATKDAEICHMGDADMFDRGTMVELLNREVIKKEAELADMKAKQSYFLKNFDAYFGGVVK